MPLATLTVMPSAKSRRFRSSVLCQGEGHDAMGVAKCQTSAFMNSMRKSEHAAGGFPSPKVEARVAVNESHQTVQAYPSEIGIYRSASRCVSARSSLSSWAQGGQIDDTCGFCRVFGEL